MKNRTLMLPISLLLLASCSSSNAPSKQNIQSSNVAPEQEIQSSNIPSEQEIQSTLTAQFGGCKYISIVNVKKLNGMPQQNGSYIVQTTFDMKFDPLEENTRLGKEFFENLAKFKQLKEEDQGNPSKFQSDMRAIGLLTDTAVFDESGMKTAGNQDALLTQQCPNKTPVGAVLMQKIWQPTPRDKLIELFANGGAMPLAINLALIKTERGWQIGS